MLAKDKQLGGVVYKGLQVMEKDKQYRKRKIEREIWTMVTLGNKATFWS